MPETDQLHPLAVENAELKRQRDEARGLLRRAEYQLVHTTPELDPTLATEIVVHLGRGD